eukprot:CAMPEP_0196719278 /NCGR_PEP_ID=MMETSP1091-20130531/2312_1 /TAXON_ID=302021 /ORGANISM="Rhodomonas sp., Strain CCMP768" /LENGTH=62 /DNA_ID=CAMNT_0042060199 /DNA_START=17 /DNA_END=205 /DNA_ORIENTATION=+
MPTKKRGSEECIELTEQNKRDVRSRARGLKTEAQEEEDQIEAVRTGAPLLCASGYPWCPYPC